MTPKPAIFFIVRASVMDIGLGVQVTVTCKCNCKQPKDKCAIVRARMSVPQGRNTLPGEKKALQQTNQVQPADVTDQTHLRDCNFHPLFDQDCSVSLCVGILCA